LSEEKGAKRGEEVKNREGQFYEALLFGPVSRRTVPAAKKNAFA